MPKKSVTLEIAADATRAEKELKKVERQLNYFKKQAVLAGKGSGSIFAPVTKNVGQLSGPLTGIASKFKTVALAGVGLGAGLGAAAVGFAAIGEGVQFIGEGLDKLKKLTAETKRLERETGMSTETSSAWIGVAQRFGLSSQQLSTGLGILSKRIAATRDGTNSATKQLRVFAQAGVSQSVLASRNMDRILVSLANRFKAMPDGVLKTDLAMKLFGRSGKTLIPILNQGGSKLGALKREMAALGLTINSNTKNQVTQLTKAQNTLKQVWDGLQIQLATRVIPRLVKFADAARQAAVGLREGRRPAQGLAADLYDVGSALVSIANALGKIAQAYSETKGFFSSPIGKALLKAGLSLSGPSGQALSNQMTIHGNAAGSIVNRPIISMVGEDGPEAIIPLSPKYRARGAALYAQAGAAMGMGVGGNTFVVNNYAGQLNEAELAARFAWQLKTRTV